MNGSFKPCKPSERMSDGTKGLKKRTALVCLGHWGPGSVGTTDCAVHGGH